MSYSWKHGPSRLKSTSSLSSRAKPPLLVFRISAFQANEMLDSVDSMKEHDSCPVFSLLLD